MNLLPSGLTEEQKVFFAAQGYIGPFTLMSPESAALMGDMLCGKMKRHPVLHSYDYPIARRTVDSMYVICQKLLAGLRREQVAWGKPKWWYKSAHLLIPEAATLGRSPVILDKIKSLMGNDLLLWGSQLMMKKQRSHRWHEDIEHNLWEGITLWLGMNEVGPENTMKLIPGSHHFGVGPQELAQKKGIDLQSDEEVLQAARTINPNAQIVELALKPGQFFMFPSHTWHASKDISDKQRVAIIFQYCKPDSRVRIPLSYDRGDKWYPAQPPVLAVSGNCATGMNHLHQPSSPGSLKGRIAVITGGSRGLGFTLASGLMNEGAEVILLAHSAQGLEAARVALEAAHQRSVRVVAADVSDHMSLQSAVKQIQAEVEKIDIWINNAGRFKALGPVWEVNTESWMEDFSASMLGSYYSCRAVLPIMKQTGGGVIINVIGGGAGNPIPYGSAYASGKAALARFTECIASECESSGIRVYGLDPGFLKTAMTTGNATSAAGKKWRPQIGQWLEQNADISPDFAASKVLEMVCHPNKFKPGLVYDANASALPKKLRYEQDK